MNLPSKLPTMPFPPLHRLIDDTALDGLIILHDGLTQERRNLIAGHLRRMSAREHDEVFTLYADAMPGEEFAFVQACFGIQDGPQPLALLLPSEQPLTLITDNKESAL